MIGRARSLPLIALLACDSLGQDGAPAPQEPPAETPVQEEPAEEDPAPEATTEPTPDAPAAAAPLPAATSPWALDGAFTLDLRYRATSDDHDTDLYGLLRADLLHASSGLEAHVLGRAAYDLDGDTDHDGAYAFDSLADTYDRRLTAQLYEAWLGGPLGGDATRWRLGRFFADDLPIPTYVDGARLETSPAARRSLSIGAYGGLPSHLYESSPEGDLIVGGFVSDRPWRDGKLRLDYMHIDDEARVNHDDDLIGLSWWQGIGEQLDFFARYTWLELEARDLTARAAWSDSQDAWRAQLAYYELFQAQTSLSYELDPFFEAAMDYEPYRQVQLSGGKTFGDHFDLAAGVDVRRLSRDQPEREFNHEFERWFVTPTLLDVPVEGMSIALTWELWDADSEQFDTLGGEIAHEVNDELTARAGTAYSLYKFDFYAEDELERVRTFYVGLDWRASRALRLRANYTLERDEFDTYSTLRMQASWTF